MSNVTKYLLIPSMAPLSLTALYFTPKSTVGCANRGLFAIALSLLSLLCAVATAWKFARAKGQGSRDALWPLAATLILMLPALLLLGPLG